MDRMLLDYLPPVIGETKEIKEICNTEQKEVSDLWDGVSQVLKEMYLEDMSEYGVNRLEKIIGLTPFDTDTISDRKFRIKTWSNSDLPYTKQKLMSMLENLCGNDYQLSLDGFNLTVKLGLGIKKQYNEVVKMLERVVPANIVITVDLLYNTYEMLAQYTHAELSAYTHGQLREEVFK